MTTTNDGLMEIQTSAFRYAVWCYYTRSSIGNG